MSKTILFNVGYYRKGWIAPIENLPHGFNIIYIFYLSKVQESVSHTQHRVEYWNDYQSAHELLERIAPDCIVFMSVDSVHSIVLNFIARKSGIKTYILQHGVYSTYKEYRERDKRAKKIEKQPQLTQAVKSNAFKFLRASLKLKDYFHFAMFPLYMVAKRYEGVFFANYWFTFNAKKPDFYISYTPHTARFFYETEKPNEEQVLFIGNTDMDSFFSGTPSSSSERYYLLIDQAMAENRYGQVIFSIQQVIDHYNKLNAFCLKHKAKLKVKLHPESYHCSWLPSHPNIEWLRDLDLADLIKNAQGCFGYFSSLMVPAMYFNKCVMFQVVNHDLVTDARDWNMAQVLNFSSFEVEDIDFSVVNKTGMSKFINRYLYFQSGTSTERLTDILKGQSK